jgi:hypothetical protein
MRNTNKDYCIILNARTATIESSGNMIFCITDEKTSNIFCKLDFIDPNANSKFPFQKPEKAPEENADDYTITLRIVKPDNTTESVEFSILDAEKYEYYVDLDDAKHKDVIGIYTCECFIDCTIKGFKERMTTNSFTYEVRKSVFNNLDNEITGQGKPLIETLATKEYVDQVVSGGINLDGYITNAQLNTALARKSDTGHTHPKHLVTVKPKNGILTLTTDEYQIASNITTKTTIVLPDVTTGTRVFDIHLFYSPEYENIEIVLPGAKWTRMTDEFVMGRMYELVFSSIGGVWIAGVITYE